MAAPRRRVGQLRREPARVVHPGEQVAQAAHGVPGRSGRVLPAFAEHRLDVADRRSLDHRLDVVPRRALAVDRRHRLALRVPRVGRVVTPAVAQVDAADEGDVVRGTAGMAEHDHLDVV